jgi:mRNA-degrading endonuclease toxin of MazEF toxin-antitoxin module
MRRPMRSPCGKVSVALLAFALRIGAGDAFAQSVTIRPTLRAGDEFKLALVRSRQNSVQPQQSGGSRTVVNVRVLSVSPDRSVVEWVQGDTALDNPQLAQNPILAAALQAARDLRVHLELNPEGELSGVANRDEIVATLKSMLEAITRELSGRLSDEQRAAMQVVVAQVLSPEALIAGATREAAMYFGLDGMSLTSGEVAETTIEQPSPFGGGVIPGVFRVRLQSLTADSASVTTATTYERAALSRLTEDLIRQAGAAVPADARASMPPMDLTDEGTYLFDRTLGLMREVIVNRQVAVGNNRRIDRWEIRLLEGPQR